MDQVMVHDAYRHQHVRVILSYTTAAIVNWPNHHFGNIASHAECITTIFILQLCVVFELWEVKHCKMLLPQK